MPKRCLPAEKGAMTAILIVDRGMLATDGTAARAGIDAGLDEGGWADWEKIAEGCHSIEWLGPGSLSLVAHAARPTRAVCRR